MGVLFLHPPMQFHRARLQPCSRSIRSRTLVTSALWKRVFGVGAAAAAARALLLPFALFFALPVSSPFARRLPVVALSTPVPSCNLLLPPALLLLWP